jgi:hypothetical protein
MHEPIAPESAETSPHWFIADSTRSVRVSQLLSQKLSNFGGYFVIQLLIVRSLSIFNNRSTAPDAIVTHIALAAKVLAPHSYSSHCCDFHFYWPLLFTTKPLFHFMIFYVIIC